MLRCTHYMFIEYARREWYRLDMYSGDQICVFRNNQLYYFDTLYPDNREPFRIDYFWKLVGPEQIIKGSTLYSSYFKVEDETETELIVYEYFTMGDTTFAIKWTLTPEQFKYIPEELITS